MEYYNGLETPNHQLIQIKNFNHFKNNSYKHSSTDNIFQNKRGDTLHKIYNKFLVNPYLIRNSRYQLALNNNINFTQDDNNYKNNYNNKSNQTSEESGKEIYEEKNEMNQNMPNNFNNYNNIIENEKNNDINFPNINNSKRENLIKSPKNIRKQILNEENKNLYKEDEYNNNPIIKYENIKFPKINNNNYKFNYKTIERPIEYNVIFKNNNNDMYFSNNKNKLSLSYDIKNKKNLKNIDNPYISPIIAKIAKHNYLMRNPYSDKNEYLGPSYLKNNPILYPISTYKFDFNRYIKNYHVNKFV